MLVSCEPAGAITIRFDMSTDTTDFFGDGNPSGQAAGALAAAALNEAGRFFKDLLADDLEAISPQGNKRWTAIYNHPSTGNSVQSFNLDIPADTIHVFVGARDLGGNVLGTAGPGGHSVFFGGSAWKATIRDRGEGTTQGEGATDFGPWGGSLAMDIDSIWHYDHTTLPSFGRNDFLTVLTHELGHILGIGTADSWDNQVDDDDTFIGPMALNKHGGPVPLDAASANAHFASGTTSTVYPHGTAQEVAMDPDIRVGSRKEFTLLDVAALDDVGWETLLSTVVGLPGDVDLDGRVDDVDLNLLLSELGATGPPGSLGGADVNGNGKIDQADLDLLLGHFGLSGSLLSGPVQEVPEPSGILLAGLGMLGLALCGRRRGVVPCGRAISPRNPQAFRPGLFFSRDGNSTRDENARDPHLRTAVGLATNCGCTKESRRIARESGPFCTAKSPTA